MIRYPPSLIKEETHIVLLGEENAFLGSDIDTVKQAIGNLKEDYQNVVIWHYLDDLPVPEIAKIMRKPEGTVRVTLHRALKALKSELNHQQRPGLC